MRTYLLPATAARATLALSFWLLATSVWANAPAAVTRRFAALSATISAQTNVSCNGGSNGSATVTASGGTAPYTYSWSPSGGTGATANSLSYGMYTVTVRDATNATTTATVNISQPPALIISGSSTDVSCNGGSNGTVAVVAAGGTAPYTYSWAPSGGTNASATNRSAGSYYCTVTDAKGCTATKQVNVYQPPAFSVTQSQVNPTCNGSANGSATVNMSGGTPPYSYDWSPGTPSGDGTNTAYNLGGTFSNYSVLVTDAKGCTANYSFTLVTPSAINVNLTTTNPSTPGGTNGTAAVSLSGGSPPYDTFRWTRTSAPAGTISANSTLTTSSVSGLIAGSYTVQANDANGCPVSRSFTILDPTATPTVTTPANNGTTLSLTPTYAGTAPAGSTVTVTVDGSTAGTTTADAGGAWTLAQPAALAYGAHTVAARAQLSGYAISASSATNTFTVLNPATYTSSTAEQPNLDRVVAGRTDQEILRVAVTIGGGPDLPLSLQSLVFATTGSTSASTTLTAARVYYTGSSSTLTTTVPFGTAVSRPDGAFTITGSQTLSAGLNYFWLVYDVDRGAMPGQVLDAELSSLAVSGTTYTPTTGSPAGNRAIVNTDPSAGMALRCTGGTTAGYVNFSANPVTLGVQYTQAVWLKPNINSGSGAVFYGVMGSGTGTSAAPYLGVWADGHIEAGFSTGSAIRSVTTPAGTLTPNQWSQVVVTFNGSQLLLYHNGSVLGTLNTTSVPVSTPVAYFGNLGPSTTPNFFPGSLDEVSLWNRALSQAEIRQLRHLTLAGTETGLLAYLQFNTPGPTIDGVRGKLGFLSGSGVAMASSTAPVSYGSSVSQTVTGAGLYGFTAARAAIDFSAAGSTPYEVVVSRLDGAPLGTQPTDASLKGTYTPAYWIIDRYSTSSFTATVRFTLGPNDLSPADATTPANLRLFKRDSNGDGAFDAPIAASSVDAAAGTVAFPVTSFSQAVIGTFGSSPLPVELVRFTAERAGPDALLRWTTAQERDNDHFEVEASTDGVAFRRLGQVAGQGTTTSAHSYVFTDALLARYATDRVYYRLRQVDRDGATQLGPVRVVEVPPANNLTVLAWPNPLSRELTVQLQLPQTGLVRLELRDALGRVHGSWQSEQAAGVQRPPVTLPPGLPSGVYILVARQGQRQAVVRLLQQ